MGFSSQDQLISALTTDGQGDMAYTAKTLGAAGIAGAWTLLGPNAGMPPLSVYTGTDLNFVATDDTWAEGTTYTGGDVSPKTKHFLSAGASVIAGAGAPWFVMAVDMVGFVPLTTTNVSTTGTKTVTMTAIGSSAAKVDRYPNGQGLRMFVAADTAMGANAPTCIASAIEFTSAGLLTASLNGAGSAVFAVAAADALLGAQASVAGSAALSVAGVLTPYAVGSMAGSTVDSGVLTVDTIAAGVLAAALAAPIRANIKQVNDIAITGDGQPGTEWGP